MTTAVRLGGSTPRLKPGCYAIAVLTIVADRGEDPAAPITFCLNADFVESATATGNYVAQLGIGGTSIVNNTVTDPLTVIRNPGGTPVTELTFGPQALMQNQPPVHQTLQKQFTAFIGDDLQFMVGASTNGSGSDVGSLHTNDLTNLALNVGACAAPAPAMSWRGLALLMLLLVGFGSLSLVPRRS